MILLATKPRSLTGKIFSLSMPVDDKSVPLVWDGKTFSPVKEISVGEVLISELSGSESLIHFRNSNMNWVSLSNGTHQMKVGQEAKLYMNVDEFMYFDQNSNLVNNV